MFGKIKNWLGNKEEKPKETPRNMPSLISGIRTQKAPIPLGTPTMEVLLRHKQAPQYHTVGISYTDVNGDTTERVISVLTIVSYPDNSDYKTIEAHCHLKNAVRHFRSDRINHFFDPKSGEIFKTVDLTSILKSVKDHP